MELPWIVVRQDREQKLERFLILGVHEKIDERSAVESFKVAPVDIKWLDASLTGRIQCL